jgi:hypothetical protein
MTELTLASLQAEIDTLKTQVPTLEDLFFSVPIESWKGSDDKPICLIPWSFRATLLVAPINVNVLSAALSFDYWTLPASSTTYWQAALEVGSGTSWTQVATKTTQPTDANANTGITARTPWTFDSATGPTPIAVQQGQLLAITWTPVGGPAALKLPMTVTIRAAAA